VDDKERIRELEEKVAQLLKANESQQPAAKRPPPSSPPAPTPMDRMADDIRTMKNRDTVRMIVRGLPGLFIIWLAYMIFKS
jgi:hypothetical protein